MFHINLHIICIYFIKLNLNLDVFQESNNYLKSYQVNKILIFYSILLQLEFTFKLEYQTSFSGEFMIQYIPM